VAEIPLPNQTVQRLTGASRFAQRQIQRHRRLAPVADLAFGVAILRARQGDGVTYRSAMSGSVDTIISEAVQLPPDQRLALAYRILSSVEPAPSAETDEAWDREIRARIAKYDAGGVQSIPAAEVFGELDQRLRQ
jgi:putative addiction module component (TIGR02574 family)